MFGDDSPETFWSAAEGATEAVIDVAFPHAGAFNCLVLQEEIRSGQKIESFRFECWTGDAWTVAASGTTVGSKRIVRFAEVSARKVRLVISGSRGAPALAGAGLYLSAPAVTITPARGVFAESVRVSLTSESPRARIFYTLDGTAPSPTAALYRDPLTLTRDAVISAQAWVEGELPGGVRTAPFHRVSMGLTLHTAFSPRYTGGGALALVDGERGTDDPSDSQWQGYEGIDLDAVIDLGASKEITGASAGFLQESKSWIFFPDSVELSASGDGVTYRPVATVRNSATGREEGSLVRQFALECAPLSCRYVRIRANNIGVCPPWHPGAGKKAWLFVDEITILTR